MTLYSIQPHETAPPPPGGGPTTPGQGAPPPVSSPAPAGGGGSSMLILLTFLPIILFMFFSSRSQQKKQKSMTSKLKKGDRVVTQSGLVGKLVDPLEGRYAKVEIAPGVKVQVLVSSIAGLDTDDTAKTKDEASTADKK